MTPLFSSPCHMHTEHTVSQTPTSDTGSPPPFAPLVWNTIVVWAHATQRSRSAGGGGGGGGDRSREVLEDGAANWHWRNRTHVVVVDRVPPRGGGLGYIMLVPARANLEFRTAGPSPGEANQGHVLTEGKASVSARSAGGEATQLAPGFSHTGSLSRSRRKPEYPGILCMVTSITLPLVMGSGPNEASVASTCCQLARCRCIAPTAGCTEYFRKQQRYITGVYTAKKENPPPPARRDALRA